MIVANASASSSAPPRAFFARWADLATWPDWNEDTEWARLDGAFGLGGTGTLKPRGAPRVRFTITRLDDHEFADTSRMPGGRITFAHRIDETADGTRLTVSVDIAGPLGFLWRRILGGGFRDSLQADLDRLVATAEDDVAADG
ncbi:MAG: SRPBCC family protein [Nocardioides sp.]